jgi:5-methyltetrahydrofolate--homocysteine methyltransferase
MRTTLRGREKEVAIDTLGPVVVIGEKINPTGRKKLAEALRQRNFDYVRELASSQAAAMADILDINVGVPGLDDVALLPEVVKVVADQVGLPICIDTPNPKALAAALPVAPGKALVNSVNGEERSLQTVLHLVKEHGAAVIGLAMDDNGIPSTPEARLAIAGKILERAAQIGIPAEDVIIDPLVLTVGADANAAAVTLRTIELVRRELGLSISLGASNVSFGLPDRHTVNQAFLALAIHSGANCLITDPLKLTATIRATDMLLGRDPYASRFIAHFRSRPKEAN